MAKTASTSEDARLKRKIWIALGVLIVIVIAFAAYYYQDRYATPSGAQQQLSDTQQLEQKVKAHPSDSDARLALAENYLLNRRYEDAVTQAQQIQKAYPKIDRALLLLGVAYSFEKQPAQAVAPLQKFVAIHEKSASARMDSGLEAARYFLGDSFVQLKRPKEAISPLRKALLINPTDADALYALGNAYAQTAKPKLALPAFQKAVLLVPDFKEAYQGMADSFKAEGRTDLAHYADGMVAFSSKDYAGARDVLLKVISKRKDYPPAFLGLGLAYEQLGDLKHAKAELKTALKLDPGNVAVKQALGRMAAALQQ